MPLIAVPFAVHGTFSSPHISTPTFLSFTNAPSGSSIVTPVMNAAFIIAKFHHKTLAPAQRLVKPMERWGRPSLVTTLTRGPMSLLAMEGSLNPISKECCALTALQPYVHFLHSPPWPSVTASIVYCDTYQEPPLSTALHPAC